MKMSHSANFPHLYQYYTVRPATGEDHIDIYFTTMYFTWSTCETNDGVDSAFIKYVSIYVK